MLHLEDRIQLGVQEIVGLFPNRINISNVEPLDFVAVGVGPLSHNKDNSSQLASVLIIHCFQFQQQLNMVSSKNFA
jgi:hypothetical protein